MQMLPSVRRQVGVFLFLCLISGFLAWATAVFAVIPMRIVRQQFGRLVFVLANVATALALFSTGLYHAAAILLVAATLIGIFAEVESAGASLFSSVLVSVAATLGLSLFAGLAYLKKSGLTIQGLVDAQLKPALTQVLAHNPGLPVDEAAIINQAPSAIIILAIISIVLGILWERRVTKSLGLPIERPKSGISLLHFSVPDWVIWLTILAIFGAFYSHQAPWFRVVSINVLNVLALVYFFQGMAIAILAFNVFRVSPIWRVFWYIIFVFQLFLALAVIGFSDYWLEYRQRLARIAKRRSAETN